MKIPLRILDLRVSIKSILLGTGMLGLAAWSPPSDSTVILGTGHTVTGANALIAGQINTHHGMNNLIIGKDNKLNHAVEGNSVYNSAAIGYSNEVFATRGWAMGWENEVSADMGVAIGVGTLCGEAMGTALGRFNEGMVSGDVLVVGNGSSETVRSSALRITDDSLVLGGTGTPVLLANPQGDISMGAYEN